MHKHGKILLLFFLGIGLPSLLLGYLALRGIQNDQALLEKERLSRHRGIVQQIVESIDGNILEIEQTLRDSIANHRSALVSSLGNLKDQQPLVEEVFLFESYGRIQFPLAEMLFHLNASPPSLSIQTLSPGLSRTIQTGQQYEFQQDSYDQALNIYRQAFARTSEDNVKGELLNAIARVQKKSKRFTDAAESYRRIIQDYGHARMKSGMPWSGAAYLELGSLYVAMNDPLSAVQTFTDLYQALIHKEWTLEKSQYEFLTQRAEESIGEILSQETLTASMRSYQNAFGKLKTEERKQREITERLITFQEKAEPDLLAKMPQSMENSSYVPGRFNLSIEGHSYLVCILSAGAESGEQDSGIWGFLLNVEQLKTGLLLPVIQQYVSSEDAHWAVRGQNGEIILDSDSSSPGAITARTDFAGNFPPWSLELRHEEPRFLKTFFTSRRGIYLYMFILLAGILVFGLTLTIRAVTHELELARMKSDFVSTISHEFKSPLTSIRQLAEMLQADRVPSEERRHRYYDVLVQQSQRLSLLVDNILDFARMEEGRKTFDFEMVDISALLKEIISTFQQRVRHEGFTIHTEIDESLPQISVDRSAIAQTITNLMDNAVKYSDKAREIYVRAFVENRHLVIAVEDSGVGIKQEDMEKVFERFYRGGDELTRAVKGSGLGLTLVKQIVEAHHGTVHVESEPGSGSTFSIRLPLEPAL